MSIPKLKIQVSYFQFWTLFYLQDWITSGVPEFHKTLADIATSESPRTVVQCFRGSAKSTWFSRALPCFELCVGTIPKITIWSDTFDLVKSHIREIRNQIEHNRFILADYPEMRIIQANEDYLKIQRPDGSTCEILARSAGSQSRGFRPSLGIVDDLENDEGVRSDVRRQQLEDWFLQSVYPSIDVGGRLIFIGTNLHPESLLAKLLANSEWQSHNFPAIDGEGKSIWPQRWPLERLQEQRRVLGTRRFNAEYMGQPEINSDPIFWDKWFRKYTEFDEQFLADKKAGLYTVIAVDPAISQKDESDNTAFVAVSATYDAEPRIYVRRAPAGHYLLHETVQKAFDLKHELSPQCLLVEAVAYQKALADEIRRHADTNRIHLPVESVVPDTDKQRRARAVQPMFERGQVYFLDNDEEQRQVMSELVLFPTGSHDDRVDALVFALTKIQQWAGRPKQSGSGRVLPKGTKINPVTGMVMHG